MPSLHHSFLFLLNIYKSQRGCSGTTPEIFDTSLAICTK
nr:MAG TPA: hypothetical protein [Caudoviricetes sp.]